MSSPNKLDSLRWVSFLVMSCWGRMVKLIVLTKQWLCLGWLGSYSSSDLIEVTNLSEPYSSYL